MRKIKFTIAMLINLLGTRFWIGYDWISSLLMTGVFGVIIYFFFKYGFEKKQS